MYPLKIKERYDKNELEKLSYRFSTAYLGNYIPGDYRSGFGSHPGVDIVPETKKSSVFACFNGKVVYAKYKSSSGNTIVIEHELMPDPNNFEITTTLYSSYLHLSKILVKVGDEVIEGDEIGITGSTGSYSTGEHLHFQIDRIEAPYHPYWPFTNNQARLVGFDFNGAVNSGLGLENAKKYTIDPLEYLDFIG